MDEEEIKNKKLKRFSLASAGIDLLVDLWEAQPCLLVPEWYSS